MSILSSETVKLYAESIGLTNLNEEIIHLLTHDTEYRLRELIQESSKFMRHSKRVKLTTEDINYALKLKHVEPIYGYEVAESLEFKLFPQGHIYFMGDKEVDFDSMLTSPLPKLPQPVTFTSHWLAIEGIQPQIPENPSHLDEHVSTLKAELVGSGTTTATAEKTTSAVVSEEKGTAVPVKHHLSKEHQAYYETVTLALQNRDDASVQVTLNSLKNDAGIQQLLPYFVQFASEMIVKNLKNLRMLSLIIKMMDALLLNPSLFVEPYLHQFMPTLLTCVVGKRLCEFPHEDHWSLRRESSRIIWYICNIYCEAYPTLQPRVMKTIMKALMTDEGNAGTATTTGGGGGAAAATTTWLGPKFGALVTLGQFGPIAVETFIIPNLQKIISFFEGEDQIGEKERCKAELLTAVGIFLKEKSKDFNTFNSGQSDVLRYLKEKYSELDDYFGDQLASFMYGASNTTIL